MRNDIWTDAERAEYNAILDQEEMEWWGRHCPVHGGELVEGECVECAGELANERRIDL